MIRIAYIAGAYTAPTPELHQANIRAAERRALSVALVDGWFPICVHGMAREWFGFVPENTALAGDIEILRRCDAVVLSSVWTRSRGTWAEIEEAHRLGMPVYEDADRLAGNDPTSYERLLEIRNRGGHT